MFQMLQTRSGVRYAISGKASKKPARTASKPAKGKGAGMRAKASKKVTKKRAKR